MQRLLLRIGLLTACVVVLLVLARVAGGRAPNALGRLFTESSLSGGQKQTCWHDICPGQTTMSEAKAMLDADTALSFDGYSSVNGSRLCWRTYEADPGFDLHIQSCLEGSEDQVQGINLFFPENYFSPSPKDAKVPMRVGELATLLGYPARYRPPDCGSYGDILFSNGVSVEFYYDKYITSSAVIKDTADYRLEIDPSLSVVYSVIIPASGTKTEVAGLSRWRGFGTVRGTLSPYCLD